MTTTSPIALDTVTSLIMDARRATLEETDLPTVESPVNVLNWPIQCTIGPGLEGAIACESKVGYVNGGKGWLIYRGYDIFELCAYSTFEEVSYLLIHGKLPNRSELAQMKEKLNRYRHLPETKRLLMGFPVEEMNTMAALRLGTNLMRQTQTYRDQISVESSMGPIASDEDSIPMETPPMGEEHAIYEFYTKLFSPPDTALEGQRGSEGLESCYHLIAGVSSITAAIARLRANHLPLEPDPELSHAANLLYQMSGKRPSPLEERIMDICLILHADHGMNASTFAAMVVASTLSDIYFSVGAGIEALNGPLHGGANTQVIKTLEGIARIENVKPWFDAMRHQKRKIMGFGHRVYKAYDPRARILGPIAKLLLGEHPEMKERFGIARRLEELVVSTLGEEKKIFPNVDFYSGLVYSALGIPADLYTPIFAVARVSGWTARVLEYLQHNRIFRPRAIYTGEYDLEYPKIEDR